MYGHLCLCLASLVISQSLDRDFLKHLEPIILSAFAEGLCVLGHSFNTHPGIEQQCLNPPSHLHRASRSARGESIGLPQVFPEYVHSSPCGLYSQECIGFFHFSLSVTVCPNSYPLPQWSSIFAFNCLQ